MNLHDSENQIYTICISPISNQLIIISRSDDPKFHVLTKFNHISEEYKFDCNLLCREQLFQKKNVNY